MVCLGWVGCREAEKNRSESLHKAADRRESSVRDESEVSPTVTNDGDERSGRSNEILSSLLGLKGEEFVTKFNSLEDSGEAARRLLEMAEPNRKFFVAANIGKAMKSTPRDYVEILNNDMTGVEKDQSLQVFTNIHLREKNLDRLFETYLAVNPGSERTAMAKRLVWHEYRNDGFDVTLNRISNFTYDSEKQIGVKWLAENMLEFAEDIDEDEVRLLLKESESYGSLDRVSLIFSRDPRTRASSLEFEKSKSE